MEAYGGAERVTEEMARVFPDAPVFAILGRAEVARRMGVAGRFSTLLPSRPGIVERYRALTPLYPALTAAVRLPEADVLLTSSYAFAMRLRTRNDAPQVCYCHTPLRFAWTVTDSYRDAMAGSGPLGPAFDAMAAWMRAGDHRSARRVTRFLTQSPYTVDQIRRFYGREATAIGAPVDCDRFRPRAESPGDYYLLVSRVYEPSKRSLVAVEAFASLGERLVVAGGGAGLARLKAQAPTNVSFVGHVDDEQLVPLMQGCRALIFPSRDAFGLTAVEAMACGRPVLALAEGGALQTVVPGLSGDFFTAQTPVAIAEAVRSFEPDAYDRGRIRAHARQWDRPAFDAGLRAAVQAAAEASSVAS